MNKLKAMLGGLVVIFMSGSLSAAMITNGDFANSCSLNGWQTDTDGFAGGTNDFTLDGSAPNCAASINVDYANTDVYYAANTLFQNLDLSGASSSTFLLTMDFSVFSESNSNEQDFIADYFMIALFDGSDYYNQHGDFGFLVSPTDIDGSQNYNLSFELDSSFANQTNWSLDFQVLLGIAGFDTDFFGSTLSISSVSLTEQKAVVGASTPASLALFALGLFGLAVRRKTF
ncbi:PEP-CTERM sorting domain-containing protein [Paraglaciecola hydrolytica]|uniref:PEP-CTERM protein-sorting domain-containing protein n=1 Tax=Paraglaciecola hydrolytica TaxID=1799789 RepID=A0A136A504_9ALTE|nr:PEP-CTERM sorting domain-containing protein [Paraglaciecola hydrolytica]KXI30294.1 hypothetical protein AX660_09945 [Paraglaciecola hydrolytica]